MSARRMQAGRKRLASRMPAAWPALLAGGVLLLAAFVPPLPTALGQEAAAPKLSAPVERAAAAQPPSLGLSLPPPAEAALPPLRPDELERLRRPDLIGVHRLLPDAVRLVSVAPDGRLVDQTRAVKQADALQSARKKAAAGGAAAARAVMPVMPWTAPANHVRTFAPGAWQTTAAGRLWRLRIASPAARALRVHFQNFDVGRGRVWLHDGAGQVHGPYTGRGRYGDGDFWSAYIHGPAMTIEYQPDPSRANTPATDAVPFRVRRISHTAEAEDRHLCGASVTCFEEDSRVKRMKNGVVRITIEKRGGASSCSASILNPDHNSQAEYDPNVHSNPLLLTAAHCLQTEDAARSLVALWKDERRCGAIGSYTKGIPAAYTYGATLLATTGFAHSEDGVGGYAPQGDISLLRLDDKPPARAEAVLQAWGVRRINNTDDIIVIHHADSDYKQITGGKVVRVDSFEPPGIIFFRSQLFGTGIDKGASGAPAFQNDTVIGVLSAAPEGFRCLLWPITFSSLRNFYYNFATPHFKGGLPPLPPLISRGGVTLATGTPVVPTISPNALISVFGEGFAPEGTRELSPRLDPSGGIADKLGGNNICLEIGGLRAPLFAVTPTQINAQAPLLPHAGGSLPVQVIQNCGGLLEKRSEAASVKVAAVSPAFFNFENNSNGRNAIIAQRSGGSFVGWPNLLPGVKFAAAAPREVVTLYGTGFGPTDPPLEAGVVPGAAANLANEVAFSVGGIAVPPEDVLYAGAAPCCAGLYQFTLRLPADLPAGAAPVTATAGGVSTPTGPFLTIGGQSGPPPSPPRNPVERFRDCPECPEMVVVPAGSFLMGSSLEESRIVNERPQHWVTIPAPFAVGAYEVTVAEYREFVSDTGYDGGTDCGTFRTFGRDFEGSWRNPGFEQTGRDPVVCVNWEDAQAYVRWLSRKTGEEYRLLSEAEWEYAARAGTTTRYSFGDEITENDANYGKNIGRTQPVGSYRANGFGLYDVHGNVHEWVQDCWAHGYEETPDNGDAWEEEDCFSRAARGGSWYDDPEDLRSASRPPSGRRRLFSRGFRVARTLRP